MKKFIKNLLNKRLNNEKGLTLIELLAVIVILAIVAAIAVPAIGNIVNDSRDKAILAEASNILSAAKLAQIDNKCDSTTNAGTTTCSYDVINPFLDGIELVESGTPTATATLTSAGWSIDYSEIANIQNGDLKPASGTSVTEKELSDFLD